MADLLLLLLLVQALRHLLFEHGLLRAFRKKFSGVPVLSAFLNCSFCQGFCLGAVVFFPFMSVWYTLAWAFVSAWLSAVAHEWFQKRGRKQDLSDGNGYRKSSEEKTSLLPEAEKNPDDTVCLLECNIDDMSGEFFGDMMQRLSALGALDVWFTSAYGKKNRPLYQLSALVNLSGEADAVRAILTHSSTAGIRRRLTERIVMHRSFIRVTVEGIEIAVKRLYRQDIVKYAPEWEECAHASRRLNKTAAEIYARAADLARTLDQK